MPVPYWYFAFYWVTLYPQLKEEQKTGYYEFLRNFRRKLLFDIRKCIMKELRHTAAPVKYPNLQFRMGDNRKFFEMAAENFHSPLWRHMFGGPAWAAIAEAAVSVHNTKLHSVDLIPLMDHLIDLCHNTGPVLNKVYGWHIYEFLNKKRQHKSPEPWLRAGGFHILRKFFDFSIRSFS